MTRRLEDALSRYLAPARAPEGLWDRIQEAQSEPRPARASAAWVRWPVAAILTLAATAGMFWLSGKADAAQPYAFVRPALAAEHSSVPADWNLSCLLPPRRAAFHMASFSMREPPAYALAAVNPPQDTAGCHQCHVTVFN